MLTIIRFCCLFLLCFQEEFVTGEIVALDASKLSGITGILFVDFFQPWFVFVIFIYQINGMNLGCERIIGHIYDTLDFNGKLIF